MTENAANKHGIQVGNKRWKSLLAGCLAHITHDGYSDTLYVFLPLWQVQFGLTFAEVGFFKTLFSGTLAAFQVPSGYLAGRIGEVRVLLAGTAVTCLSFGLFSWAATPAILGLMLVLCGLGESVQHPISSTIISNAYLEEKMRRKALSTYNFSGDVGKMMLPGVAAVLISLSDWQMASKLLSLLGFVVTAFVFFITRDIEREEKPDSFKKSAAVLLGWKGYQAFWSLSAIGIIDSATRMGFLTFFPFLLINKGADIPLVGLSLTLVFAGGATGKLVCGFLANRFGIIRSVIVTEIATAVCIGAILNLPLLYSMILSPVLGIALNGTSSVLYGSVPELVPVEKRNQAFAVFYTATIGSGAISPAIYGLISDIVGISNAVGLVAFVVLAAIPLTLLLRGKMAQ